MTQRNEQSPGEPAFSATTSPVTAPVADSSPWAPLRQRAFRWLWLGVLISYIGTWMQTVGAQWLVVEGPNAATVVALVQAANTLPVMLLALPGGVLADSFDRRWLLFTVQAYFFVVGVLLVVLTIAGQMPPVLLLAFTFALGVGAAVQLPAWQAVIPELVPRTQLGAATRLEMVGVNFARSVGPALAGLVIAWSGVPAVFALNALSVTFLAAALLFWRRRQTASEVGRERFVPALRAGGRYVWHEPVVRRILLRTMLFIAPAVVLWALLPLVATQRLGLGADGYGVLFAALGIGAVLGALVLGRVRARLSTNAMLGAACVLYAAGLAAIVLAPNFGVALVILVFTGLAWTAAISTLNAELALFLPVWVRARGLAVYMVVFTGSMSAGALDLGIAGRGFGVTNHLLSRGRRGDGRRDCWSFLVSAGDRQPGPRAGCLLGRAQTGFRACTRRGTGPRDRRVRRHPGAGAGVPRGDVSPAPGSPANRRDKLGALPRRRATRSLRRDLQRAIVGGAPASARRPPDRNRPGDRGSGAGVSPILRHGPNICYRRSCQKFDLRSETRTSSRPSISTEISRRFGPAGHAAGTPTGPTHH